MSFDSGKNALAEHKLHEWGRLYLNDVRPGFFLLGRPVYFISFCAATNDSSSLDASLQSVAVSKRRKIKRKRRKCAPSTKIFPRMFVTIPLLFFCLFMNIVQVVDGNHYSGD